MPIQPCPAGTRRRVTKSGLTSAGFCEANCPLLQRDTNPQAVFADCKVTAWPVLKDVCPNLTMPLL